MDTTTDKKKDLTNRLLAISGEKYLNGSIPLAKCFIDLTNSNRIKLLEEILEAGCTDKIITDKLMVEIKNEYVLSVIQSEISQMYKDGETFMG